MTDLIGIQESSKRIRNPFGFDFVFQYNKKKSVLKGDGQWRTVVGPLRDHIARHLFMKIRYQLHDEEVAKLRAKGDDKGARKYSVPQSQENLIWEMITGEKRGNVDETSQAQEAADLTELRKSMDKMDAKAMATSPTQSISSMLQAAQTEALADAADLGAGEAKRSKGSATLAKAKAIEPAEPEATTLPEPALADAPADETVTTTPSDGEPASAPEDAPAEPSAPAGEFPELETLEGQDEQSN